MKYFLALFIGLFVFACSSEIPDTGSERTVTEKQTPQTPMIITVTNVNENYFFDGQDGITTDNLTLSDNITISIVNNPVNTNVNTNCNRLDNGSDNCTSDNATAFLLQFHKG